ncbi:MAG: hypothetical protein ACFFFY_09365, partial [Promethearchaeota archaeon]
MAKKGLKMKKLSNNRIIKYLQELEWSPWWRLPRILLYIFGIVTFFFYFWSFIGLIIGIFYFIFFTDVAWKRNG